MGNPPQKKSGKNFLMGDFHAIHYPMGNSPPHLFLWEIPTTRKNFPYGKFPAFFTNPLWEIPTRKTFPYGKSPLLFTIPPPMGNSPKKNLEKNFSSGYMDNCSPKNGGAPWGEGAWGDTYPPLWDIWGG